MATNNAIDLSQAGLARYDGAGTFTGVTVTNHATLVGASSNGITSVLQGAGQILIGTTAGDPTAATLTPGTGIAITSVSGAITINSTGGGLSWVVVSGTSQSMAVNTGYTSNNASLCTMTLPTTAAVGDTIVISGLGAGGWLMAQNASQLVHVGSTVTTTGISGSIASTNAFDSVTITCVVANTTWIARSAIGNLTIV